MEGLLLLGLTHYNISHIPVSNPIKLAGWRYPHYGLQLVHRWYDKRNSKPLIGYLQPISSETGDCSFLPHKSIPINQVLSGKLG